MDETNTGELQVRDPKTGKFVPGKPPTGGRPKGSKNKMTLDKAKELLNAQDGSLEALVEEVKAANPSVALKIITDMMLKVAQHEERKAERDAEAGGGGGGNIVLNVNFIEPRD